MFSKGIILECRVEGLEKEIKRLNDTIDEMRVENIKIEETIVKIISGLFKSDEDYTDEYIGYHLFKMQTIKVKIKNIIIEGQKEASEFACKKVVAGETFMDDLVDRINRKQIKK